MSFKPYLLLSLVFVSCSHRESDTGYYARKPDTVAVSPAIEGKTHFVRPPAYAGVKDSLVNFAQRLIGTPYLYASVDPTKGFDCSGFVNYVFNHFGYEVPRSSRNFEFFGTTIPIEQAQTADLILFTGTDTTSTQIGHIGIITKAEGMNSEFIHSSSGKAYGVTLTPLATPHYQRRFVKVVRVIE